MKLYSVYDRIAGNYSNPMAIQNDAVAMRSFKDEINTPAETNMLYKHPEDYDLYFLGEFDPTTGTFNCDTPIQVVRGATCKESN